MYLFAHIKNIMYLCIVKEKIVLTIENQAMDKETKMQLLNSLIEIKSQRKTMQSLFHLFAENKDKIDMGLIDKILDADDELRKKQEIIEKKLNN